MPREKGAARQKRKAPSQGREYSKRPRRAPVSYADPEDSDDSAFYETDEDGEGVTTRKVPRPKQDRPLPRRKIFPFLSLPRELRDIIYDYALGCPSTVTTTTFPATADFDADPNSDSSRSRTTTTTTAASNVIRLQETTAGFRRDTMRVGHSTRRLLAADGVTALRFNTGDDGILCRLCKHEPAPLATGLLGVSRQLRAEAARVLYGGARFQFVDSVALLTFVGRLSRDTRGLLRDVRLLQWQYRRSLCQGFDKAVFELLAEGVTGLRAFRFESGSYSAKESRWEARKICRLGWRWLEAMAREKEDGFDGVLEVLSAGIRAWGDDWKVGEEKWTLFAKECKALMKAEVE